MMIVVTYLYDPTKSERMDEVRPVHREFLTGLAKKGVLVAGGPWIGPEPGAYLIMRAETGPEALEALDPDPFFTEGFILDRPWKVWNPLIGILG